MLGHNSYLGEKGYTILKQYLGVKDSNSCEKLSVKPSFLNHLSNQKPFLFIENHKKNSIFPDISD